MILILILIIIKIRIKNIKIEKIIKINIIQNIIIIIEMKKIMKGDMIDLMGMKDMIDIVEQNH